jgi:hypothetical protein
MKSVQAFTFAVAAVLAMLLQTGAQPTALAAVLNNSIDRTKQIDPCAFASAATLKVLLQTGLTANPPGYFPYAVQNGGAHFKISNPRVEQVTCPHMTLTVKADVQYRETRGFPQFQTGGVAEFQSPLVANVVYQAPITVRLRPGAPSTPPPVTVSQVVSGNVVLTDINITSLKIDKVPGWLDPPWIRECLNGQYSFCPNLVHRMSFDVTSLIKLLPGSTPL